jgi:tetratricopeptide (TPR) repeat protein
LSEILQKNTETKTEDAKLITLFRDRAGNYFHQASSVDPSSQPAQSKMGIHFAHIGKLKEAEEGLIRAIELCLSQSLPIDQLALWELGNVLEQLGEMEKAQRFR